ncbi:MAG: beta-ketoacyl-[acyl-carrier-protein] synthase family protein [Desulfobaccales bacterium]
MRRVAITGLGILSPIGNSLEAVLASLFFGTSGIRRMSEWDRIKGLKSLVAGVVEEVEPRRIARKYRRTMGRVAILAALASLDALADAKLDEADVTSERTGVAMGSTTGSAQVLEHFFGSYLATGGILEQEGTNFMKIMGHTVAANVGMMLGVRGRLIAPCSACASSTQAIGYGYEAIKDGYQDLMFCGGADDLHPITAGVFDILNAASRNFNDAPHTTPRPFDIRRDGLVVSEGGAVVVLEEYGRARKRGAKIYGEILGYGTCCDGRHMTSPSQEGMVRCMRSALEAAAIQTTDLDYINAHATGTDLGDTAECQAIQELIGNKVPVSSNKGYTGHTLAACGAIELIFCLLMMKHGFIAPTLNLEEIDPACGGIGHVQEKVETDLDMIMTNSFAFGGVNAVLILKKES